MRTTPLGVPALSVLALSGTTADRLGNSVPPALSTRRPLPQSEDRLGSPATHAGRRFVSSQSVRVSKPTVRFYESVNNMTPNVYLTSPPPVGGEAPFGSVSGPSGVERPHASAEERSGSPVEGSGAAALTIFIVEDEPEVRESSEEVLSVLGAPIKPFATSEQFLLNYLKTTEQGDDPPAGCAVVDVRMPGMNGLELQREINRRQLPLTVIVLTGHGDVPMSVEAMRHGAIDFLQKPVDPDILRKTVVAGLDRAARLVQAREAVEKVAARESNLTARETEVYHLLLKGLETKQIGHQLGISPSTVEKHRLKVFDKMGVDTVPRLIRFVLDSDPQRVERDAAATDS